MRNFAILPLILLFALSASQPPLVRINLATEPTSLDPRQAYDSASTTVALLLGEGLVRIDSSDEPTLALAKAVRISDDGLRYTFDLREARWSDGEPLTALDFERSWREALDKNFGAEWSYLLFAIKGSRVGEPAVQAVGERTLVVELDHPDPAFLKLIAAPPFMPYREGAQCGPFLLRRWDRGRELVAERNPLYWDAASVHLAGVKGLFVDSEHTELCMYEQGELDWAGAPNSVIPLDAIPPLRDSGQLRHRPILGVYLYKFNTAHPLLRNAKVRRALSAVISRDKLAEHTAQGTHIPAYGLLSRPQPPSTAQAQALFRSGLAELGLELNGLPPLELSLNTNDDHLAFAQAIQQQWQATFGIRVRLSTADWQVHLARLHTGKYEVGRHAWLAQVDSPVELLRPFASGNEMGWENAAFNRLLERAERSANPETLLQEAEALFLAEMPAAPLFFLTYSYLCNPALEGAFLSPLGRLDLRWAKLR